MTLKNRGNTLKLTFYIIFSFFKSSHKEKAKSTMDSEPKWIV